jgi:hypothetical protein
MNYVVNHDELEAEVRRAVTSDQRLCMRSGYDILQCYLASREEARQLRAERERLREALKPLADQNMPEGAYVDGDHIIDTWVRQGDVKRARAALSPTFDQRDPGDETPERPRPRRDGPGLDVKALADLEGRN